MEHLKRLLTGAGLGLITVGTLVATQNQSMPIRVAVGAMVAYSLGFVVRELMAKKIV